MKMLITIIILLVHYLHSGKSFTITKVTNPGFSNTEDITSITTDSIATNINATEKAIVPKSSNVMNLTKTTKSSENKYSNNVNVFTLTTKFSIDNDTENDLITTAEGVLTVKLSDKDQIQGQNDPINNTSNTTNTDEGNTIVDNITTSYPTSFVTISGLKTNEIGNDNNLLKTAKEKDNQNKTLPVLGSIDDVTIYDNEIDSSKKILSVNEINSVIEPIVPSNLSDEVFVEKNNTFDETNRNLADVYVVNTNKLNNITSLKFNKPDNSIPMNSITEKNVPQKKNEPTNKLSTNKHNIFTASQLQLVEENTKMQIDDTTERSKKDLLSVQPISGPKTKNSSLYTVKPSYKRPKKLEITQPKPFLRDPNDNSWRNESIGSLGIVFKAKNATKPFNLVVKNKTETEITATLQKLEKDGTSIPELKQRLEKLSERRKSKKRPEENTMGGDYDEITESDVTSDITTVNSEPLDYSEPKHEPPLKEQENKFMATTQYPKMINFFDEFETIFDEKKMLSTAIDLNNITSTQRTTTRVLVNLSSPAKQFKPDRVATLQYFPPKDKKAQPFKNLGNDLNKILNSHSTTIPTKDDFPINLPPIKSETIPRNIYDLEKNPINYSPGQAVTNMKNDIHYNIPTPINIEYSITASPNNGEVDVIKHFRDYEDIVRSKEFDRNAVRNAFEPTSYVNDRGATVPNKNHYGNYYTNEGGSNEPYKDNVYYSRDNVDEYDNNFRPERFSVSYPVLFNNSVIHNANANGRVSASSSTFVKRLYDDGILNTNVYNPIVKPCDVDCEKLTVELSPAYELHYYVPDEEEKAEVEPRVTYPFIQIKHLRHFNLYNRDGL